jgi:hypothetical protein
VAKAASEANDFGGDKSMNGSIKKQKDEKLFDYFWANDFFYVEIRRLYANKYCIKLHENVTVAQEYFQRILEIEKISWKYLVNLGIMVRGKEFQINPYIIADTEKKKLLADFRVLKNLPEDGRKLLNYIVELSSFYEYYPDELCKPLDGEVLKDLLKQNASSEAIKSTDLPRPPVPVFLYGVSNFIARDSKIYKNKNKENIEPDKTIDDDNGLQLTQYARFVFSLCAEKDKRGQFYNSPLNILPLPRPIFEKRLSSFTTIDSLESGSTRIGKMFKLFTIMYHSHRSFVFDPSHELADKLFSLFLAARKDALHDRRDNSSKLESANFKRIAGLYLCQQKRSVQSALQGILKTTKSLTEYNNYKESMSKSIAVGTQWFVNESSSKIDPENQISGLFFSDQSLFDFDASTLKL